MNDPEPRPQPTPLDYLALALAGAAALMLAAGLVFAVPMRGRTPGLTENLVILANATSPFTALLTLGAVSIAVTRRRGGDESPADGIAIGIATVVALACTLLALNGVVVELAERPGAEGAARLSRPLYHLASAGLSSVALWFAATAPTRRGTRPAASPPPSPPHDQDPGSPP